MQSEERLMIMRPYIYPNKLDQKNEKSILHIINTAMFLWRT